MCKDVSRFQRAAMFRTVYGRQTLSASAAAVTGTYTTLQMLSPCALSHLHRMSVSGAAAHCVFTRSSSAAAIARRCWHKQSEWSITRNNAVAGGEAALQLFGKPLAAAQSLRHHAAFGNACRKRTNHVQSSRLRLPASHATRHTPLVTRHTPLVAHTSHVTHHTSHITRHTRRLPPAKRLAAARSHRMMCACCHLPPSSTNNAAKSSTTSASAPVNLRVTTQIRFKSARVGYLRPAFHKL